PLAAGSYQAWVRVTTAGGTSAWSPDYNFTITPPAIPTLTAPAGSTGTLTPTFTWSASTDAARYDLWVNNLTTGQAQVIRQQNLSTNTFTPTIPLNVGSYVAWVAAFNNGNQTRGWSPSFNFSVVATAAQTQITPTGTITTTTPT